MNFSGWGKWKACIWNRITKWVFGFLMIGRDKALAKKIENKGEKKWICGIGETERHEAIERRESFNMREDECEWSLCRENQKV